MGQYYAPVILKEDWKEQEQPVLASLKCYDFDNGAKLMEHSYVHNNFVGAAMKMINMIDPELKGVKFAWVGDYADEKDTKVYPLQTIKKEDKEGSIWYDTEGGVNIHSMAWIWMEHGNKENKTPEYEELLGKLSTSKLYNYNYIINWDKRMYVKVPRFKKDTWTVHPLPILTADGNGRGGGDRSDCYPDGTEKENTKFVGTWAYDRISVTNDKKNCEGLTELDWFPEMEY